MKVGDRVRVVKLYDEDIGIVLGYTGTIYDDLPINDGGYDDVFKVMFDTNGISGRHSALYEMCREQLEVINKNYIEVGQSTELAVALEELNEYKRLESEGLLLRLPCKIGDTIYYIDSVECNKCKYCTGYDSVLDFSICSIEDEDELYCPNVIKSTKFDLRHLKYIGDCYFLTIEEAEKALTELEATHKYLK